MRLVVITLLSLASCRTFPLIPVPDSPAAITATRTAISGRNRESPPTDITQVQIHREGGCLGFYKSTDSRSEGPEFSTGPCAEYTLTIHADGTAEYVGRRNVPKLGRRIGRLEPQTFRRLTFLAEEIGFEQWEPRYPVPSEIQTDWTCVTMDGEGPVTVSIVRRGKRISIENDPNMPAPAWLGLYQAEIDRIGEAIVWSTDETDSKR